MNERIRELAEQAWIDTKEEFDSIVDDGGSINFTFAHAYDQKFAELIVGECAELCSTHEMADEPFGEKSYRKGHHFDVMIRQHFGVE